jgi:hypothetical protein
VCHRIGFIALNSVTVVAVITLAATAIVASEGQEPTTKAMIDGIGPDWKELREAEFVNVNCDPDTWAWKGNTVTCSGKPTGVIRTNQELSNFEVVLQWKHLQSAGNSGVFIWATPDSIAKLKPGQYPQGVEVQILDHGFKKQYEDASGKKADWFTTNGDVFPVNGSRMKPFAPISPDGERSFPRKEVTNGFGQWNHYYIRCINGEVRLWVNGDEVSGGNNCDPRKGYLCLESEGAPIEFKNIRVRELP